MEELEDLDIYKVEGKPLFSSREVSRNTIFS